MKRITHPRTAHAVGGEALVVLAPDFFVFEGVGFPQFAAQIPGEGVDFAAFFDIFDDDGEVGTGLEEGLEPGVDADQLLDEGAVIADVAEVGGVFGVDNIQVFRGTALFLRFRSLGVEHVPVGRGGDDVINGGEGELGDVIGKMCGVAIDDLCGKAVCLFAQFRAFLGDDLPGDFGVVGVKFDAVAMPPRAERRHERAPRPRHGVEDNLPGFGEEADEFFHQRFRELSRVAAHVFLARGRSVDEPGFLEFDPFFGVEVVEVVVFHE